MKVISVIILTEAADDLEAGRMFYDERQPGIGDHFVTCLLDDIASLKVYAGIHAKHIGLFRALSKRFPYVIYYDIDAQIVRGIAVLDMRMNPDTIRESVSQRS